MICTKDVLLERLYDYSFPGARIPIRFFISRRAAEAQRKKTEVILEREGSNVILSGCDVFGIIARDYSIKNKDVPSERLYLIVIH